MTFKKILYGSSKGQMIHEIVLYIIYAHTDMDEIFPKKVKRATIQQYHRF